MSKNVVVVGSLNMDLVTQTAKIPIPGETVIGGDLLTVPGGKGANQAVAAARQGAAVTMVGRVGDDLFAQRLRDNLTAVAINHQHVVTTADAATGVALIIIDAHGENCIVVAPGANGRITPADIDAAAADIAAADILLLQLEIPLPAVQRAAEIAHEHAVTVVLNPAPAQPLPPDLLALVDVLIPNESETTLLSGRPVETAADMRAAAQTLRASGIGAVILTLGARGALLADDTGVTHFHPFTPPRIVDTTAAGDAFVGGLAAALAAGHSLTAAVPWGNAAGALAVSQLGAQTSLPTHAATAALLAQATTAQKAGIPLAQSGLANF